MNEKLCRLCLNAISDSNFLPIEDFKDNLNELLLNLNLDVSDEAVVCYTCGNNLQITSNLKKTACVNADIKFILLDTKTNKLDSEANNTDRNPVENQKICRFCRKSLGVWDYTSLNESKENVFLVTMLRKHIPEWNLNCTDELLTCYACLASLQSLLNFIMNCLDVEEKINRYIEKEGTNGKGQIVLNDVQKFTFEPLSKYEVTYANITKREGDGECEENNILTKTEIKCEEEEIDNTDLNIKSEELDIVLKESDCERFQEYTPETTSLKCHACTFVSTSKDNLKQHKALHKNPPNVAMYMCEVCLYETKRKDQIKRHRLLHKDPSDATTDKRKRSPHEAKHQGRLKRRTDPRERPSETTKFKCDLCTYEGKRKDYLKRHKLIHISHMEITTFKCELCMFETKRRDNLQQHKLLHKNPSEITMFRCELCPYKAKHHGHLKRHKLTHESLLEATKLKCDVCMYETRHKDNLKRHVLTHKSTSKLIMFRCELCLYETKRADHLKRHKLVHKSPSDITMYNCETCPYKSKYWDNFNRHKSKCSSNISSQPILL